MSKASCILFASLFATTTFAQTPTPAAVPSAPTAASAAVPSAPTVAPTPAPVAPATAPAQAAAPVDLATVNLDRLQMRDGGLSCNDLKTEVAVMDEVYKAAGGGEAGRGEMSNAATASAVGQVATGAAIQSGAFGALPLFGPLARLGTQVVMDQKTVETQNNAKRADAAKARKEHLTELFLKRDCRL
ncbi:MAG: hypothetical protein Q8M11_18490 [Sulfuritalea sp.]|nr:hypothetical protein [Sulfuritalea sp.]MDP1985492.1 hypothetical protein [Sulfuritalea sp.]